MIPPSQRRFLSAFVSLALFSALLGATHLRGQATLRFEFHEGTELEAVPSPNGRLIALQLWRHIWVLDESGGNARLLTDPTNPPAEHLAPAWSPDSKTILFAMMFADREKRENPHLVSVTDGNVTGLPPAFAAAVAWSPDGGRFLSLRDGRLWSVSRTDTMTTRLNPDSLQAKDPSWSPDGRWVAFSSGGPWWSGRSLYVVSAAGDSLRELTRGSDYVPSWSPDGRRLFFISDRSGLPQIWTVSVNGGEPTQLTNEPEIYPYAPRWWAARKLLLYTAAGKIQTLDPASGVRDSIPFSASLTIRRESHPLRRPVIPSPGVSLSVSGIHRPAVSPDGRSIIFGALGDLWLRRQNGRVEQLTTGPDYEGDAAWSPKSARVAFVSERRGKYTLWVLHPADGSRRQLTTAGRAQTPVWHPSGDSLFYRDSWDAIKIVATSGGEPRTVMQSPGLGHLVGWSKSGRGLVYLRSFQERGQRPTTAVRGLTEAGDSSTLFVSDPRAKVQFATLSSGGDSLAYVSNGELWILPLAGAVRTPGKLLDGPVFFPSWSGDGRIIYMSGEKLMQLDMRTGTASRLPVELSYRVPTGPSLLLRNARILSPEPRRGRWDMVLESGRIRAIRPTGRGGMRADSVIDLGGRTLIPGLFDVHRHAGWFGVAPSDQSALLYRGITSVGDAGSEGYWLREQQEAIQSGLEDGPRIFLAGQQITGASGNQPPTQLQAAADMHVDRYVGHLAQLGAAHVKAYNQWDAWVEAAVIREAHRRGMRTLSHFLRPSSVAAGLDRKEHEAIYMRGWVTRYRQDVLDILRRASITLVPTSGPEFPGCTARRIAQLRSLLEDDELVTFMSPEARETKRRDIAGCPVSPNATRAEEAFLYNVGAAHRAGVRIAAGSDSDLLTQEIMELLVAAGLTPLEALRAATSNAAATLGVEDRLGSIREGAIADLVVVEGDPLTNIADTKRVWGVIKDGRWIDRPQLLARARSRLTSER